MILSIYGTSVNAMFHQHKFYYTDIELYKSHYLSYIL